MGAGASPALPRRHPQGDAPPPRPAQSPARPLLLSAQPLAEQPTARRKGDQSRISPVHDLNAETTRQSRRGFGAQVIDLKGRNPAERSEAMNTASVLKSSTSRG